MTVALLCQGGDSRRNGTDFPEKRLGEGVGTGTPGGGSRLVPPAQFPTAPFLPAEPGSARHKYYYFVIYSLIYSFIKCLLSLVQM